VGVGYIDSPGLRTFQALYVNPDIGKRGSPGYKVPNITVGVFVGSGCRVANFSLHSILHLHLH
jgi:hypothetical protein